MPNHKCDHEENRKKVCAPCGRKISVPVNDLSKYSITSNLEQLIKKHLRSGFNLLDSKYPTSICVTCRKILNEHERNDFRRSSKFMPNYEDVVFPRSNNRSLVYNTAQGDYQCLCYICRTARYKGHNQKKLGVGESLDIRNKITHNNGLFARSFSGLKIESSTSNTDVSTIRRCDKCFERIGKGLSHSCARKQNDEVVLRRNIVSIAEKLPNNRKLQIASELINQCKQDGQESLEMNTSGRKRIVYFQEKQKNEQFSEECLNNFQISSGVSNNFMKRLTNFLRCKAGRKSVPSYYFKCLSEKSKILDHLYKVDTMEFDTKNSGRDKRSVVWGNAEELIEEVLDRRDYVGNYVVKVTADGGQNFLKLCMSIIPESEIEEEYEPIPKKRKLYSEGGSAAHKPISTSVHRLILLCIVPDVSETYDNMQTIFNLTKINDISFKFVADFKLLLIVNGQQTATATFPCPYCFVSLQDLKKRVDLTCDKNNNNNSDHNNDSGHSGATVGRQLKTYGDLRADFQKYKSLGSDKKLARDCHSTFHEPLFAEDDNTCVAEKCLIPELHILQGVVNQLFWHGLVDLVGRDKAMIWPNNLHLDAKSYHGGIFEGNACRRLLLEADKLMDPKIYHDHGSGLALLPFVNAFKAMNKIVECCFSNTRTDSDLSSCIKELKRALLATEVSETLKIHVVLEHVEECLGFLEYDTGLGVWSEQAGESAHREFLKYWNKRKINNMGNPLYPTRLRDAVVEFSSKHV